MIGQQSDSRQRASKLQGLHGTRGTQHEVGPCDPSREGNDFKDGAFNMLEAMIYW